MPFINHHWPERVSGAIVLVTLFYTSNRQTKIHGVCFLLLSVFKFFPFLNRHWNLCSNGVKILVPLFIIVINKKIVLVLISKKMRLVKT